MNTDNALCLIVGLLAAVAAAGSQTVSGQEPLWRQVLRLDDAGQAAFAKSALDGGLQGEQGSALGPLTVNRSSLVLPIIEKKIEEVLSSQNPATCFTVKGIDHLSFLAYAADLMWYGSEEESLRVFSKLLKVDEKRFDRAINGVLTRGINTDKNPFSLAYWGFGLGDPAVDKRIAVWAEGTLAGTYHEYAGGPPSMERRWAEVLVERYGGVPLEEQWRTDPIVLRLKAEVAGSLRDEVYRLAAEEWGKNPRHIRSMDEAQVISLTRARLDGIEASYDGQHPLEIWDALFSLARARSSVVLKVVESRMDEVLKSAKSPKDLSQRAQRLLGACAFAIEQAADEPALRIAAKYLNLELIRPTVGNILSNASQRGNPFGLIYAALDLANPELNKLVVRWAEEAVRVPGLNTPKDKRHLWAEAMVARYGAAPTDAQWSQDPLVTRLRPELARAAHDEVRRFAVDAVNRPARK
jgi:hypothetical protein